MTPQELKELRRIAGVSQDGLARKLGMSRNQVQRWEGGKNPISQAMEIAIRAVLGAPK